MSHEDDAFFELLLSQLDLLNFPFQFPPFNSVLAVKDVQISVLECSQLFAITNGDNDESEEQHNSQTDLKNSPDSVVVILIVRENYIPESYEEGESKVGVDLKEKANDPIS